VRGGTAQRELPDNREQKAQDWLVGQSSVKSVWRTVLFIGLGAASGRHTNGDIL
jgi:hypothetical protein